MQQHDRAWNLSRLDAMQTYAGLYLGRAMDETHIIGLRVRTLGHRCSFARWTGKTYVFSGSWPQFISEWRQCESWLSPFGFCAMWR